MAKHRTGLSPERGEAVAQELSELHDRMIALSLEVMSASPKPGHLTRQALAAANGVTRWRASLELALACEDHGI